MTLEQAATITEAEWEVIRVIWAQKQTTSKEVTAILAEKKGWKATTVKTLLRRLLDKKRIAAQHQGNKFVYTALIAEEESLDFLTQRFLEKVCNRKIGNVLAQMLTQSQLSLQDIAQLESLLAEQKKSAKETAPCYCVTGQCTCVH